MSEVHNDATVRAQLVMHCLDVGRCWHPGLHADAHKFAVQARLHDALLPGDLCAAHPVRALPMDAWPWPLRSVECTTCDMVRSPA